MPQRTRQADLLEACPRALVPGGGMSLLGAAEIGAPGGWPAASQHVRNHAGGAAEFHRCALSESELRLPAMRLTETGRQLGTRMFDLRESS